MSDDGRPPVTPGDPAIVASGERGESSAGTSPKPSAHDVSSAHDMGTGPARTDVVVPDGPAATPRAVGATATSANEAVPASVPPEGILPSGSIPAAQRRRAWARVQATNWRLFLVRLVCAGLAVLVTVGLLPGLGFTGWRWGQLLLIALVFGLLNATVKPLLQFLVLRFIFSTYGIVVAAVNAVLLFLLGAILEDTFSLHRPIALLVGGAVVGVVGLAFETVLGATPPVLDRDYRERNGL